MPIESPNIQELENVAQRWSQVDFENLQKNLNEEVKAIDVREDECRKARQQLITESKNYYDHADKQSRKAVTPLIKAFQAEYDRTTERAKAAEACLILICRTFTTVSDPSPYLGQIAALQRELERLYSVDEQNDTLNKELNELRNEYGNLQNQALTVRKLREQIKEMEAKTSSAVQAAISEKEKELRAELEAFEREIAEKREELSAENKALSNAVADLEIKNKEANRMLKETKMQLVQKDAVNNEKFDIVNNDLEIAIERAKEAEMEADRLQKELDRISRTSASPNEETSEDISLLRSKDSQIRKLLEENKKLNTKLNALKMESNERIDMLTRELEHYVELVAQLRTQLEAQSDYEDNKKELRILRSIEFGEENGEEGNFVSSGVTTTATATAEVQLGGRSKALDELLVGKNRKLQSENVELRMRNKKLEEDLIAAENVRLELEKEVERQRELIARLEADLLSLNAVLPRPCADGAETNQRDFNDSEFSTMDMLAKELAVPVRQQMDAQEAGNDMLSIVSAQRDRLHHKIEKLECDLSAQKQNNKYLENERDKIREDNIKLYEKIKFLQSYQTRGEQISVKVENDETEARYANEYERYLDPFRKFNLQERQRKYGQLRAYDKAALGLGQWLISSGRSRALFLFYLMFLHILIFVVLYHFANTESCQRDFQADCTAQFRQHMHKYHPNSSDEFG